MRWSRLTEFCLLLLMLLQMMRETKTKGTPTHGRQLECSPDFISGARKTENRNQQLILTDYAFDCWAIITNWEANIMMGPRPSSVIEFQVWRQLEEQSRYELVGNNTYTRPHGPGSRRQRRNKLTLDVNNSQRIVVQPGDIVGVYISKDGDSKIEFDGRDNQFISTHIITRGELPLKGFSFVDLSGFQEVNGAPLIRATVEQVEPSPVVPLPVQTIETSIMTSLTTTTLFTSSPPDTVTHSQSATPAVLQTTTFTQTETPKSTPDVGKRTEQDVSLWEKHQSLFLSVAVCGFILILLCAALALVLCLYVKARLKQGGVARGHGGETTGEEEMSANRQRHSSMFSLLPLDTARRNNLIAFKRRQTAPKVMTTSMNTEQLDLENSERVYEDMYDLASSVKIVAKPPPGKSTLMAKDELRISMKENPSYTMHSEKLPEENGHNVETQNSLEQSENVYDVPVFAHPVTAPATLPSEYEVPVGSGSPELTSSGYMTPHCHPSPVGPVQPCYENTMEKSNVYTEIDI